jgi:hypothetical protein
MNAGEASERFRFPGLEWNRPPPVHNGLAGGWPADDLGIILFRCADRFCHIRYGESTIEQFRETSNCSDSQNAERSSFQYQVVGGQRVSELGRGVAL